MGKRALCCALLITMSLGVFRAQSTLASDCPTAPSPLRLLLSSMGKVDYRDNAAWMKLYALGVFDQSSLRVVKDKQFSPQTFWLASDRSQKPAWQITPLKEAPWVQVDISGRLYEVKLKDNHPWEHLWPETHSVANQPYRGNEAGYHLVKDKVDLPISAYAFSESKLPKTQPHSEIKINATPQDNKIFVWNPKTGKALGFVDVPKGARVEELRPKLLVNENIAVAYISDNSATQKIYIWNSHTGTEIATIDIPFRPIEDVQILNDGITVLVKTHQHFIPGLGFMNNPDSPRRGNFKSYILLMKPKYSLREPLAGVSGDIHSFHMSKDGSRLEALNSHINQTHVWDTKTSHNTIKSKAIDLFYSTYDNKKPRAHWLALIPSDPPLYVGYALKQKRLLLANPNEGVKRQLIDIGESEPERHWYLNEDNANLYESEKIFLYRSCDRAE